MNRGVDVLVRPDNDCRRLASTDDVMKTEIKVPTCFLGWRTWFRNNADM